MAFKNVEPSRGVLDGYKSMEFDTFSYWTVQEAE